MTDPDTMALLLQLCRTVNQWLEPVLYRTVVLSTSAKICSFYTAHHVDFRTSESKFPTFIRTLWFGPTPGPLRKDLNYGSRSWPIPMLQGILTMCTDLRSLTVYNLDQNQLPNISRFISPSVQSLTLGPVHGAIILENFHQDLRLKEFTSGMTYMRDSEVQVVIVSPRMRRFRRISPILVPRFYLEQIPGISKSTTLEEMSIIVCDCDLQAADETAESLRKQLPLYTNDKRVTITSSSTTSWEEFIYGDLEAEREAYIGVSNATRFEPL